MLTTQRAVLILGKTELPANITKRKSTFQFDKKLIQYKNL